MSSKRRVLIVDDDTSILEALDLTLQSFGYQTKTLAAAGEIYDAIKNFKPDVIILDVLLSGIDGKAVCQGLKANLSTAGIPVIMVSAHPDLKKFAQNSGADDYLEKPFDLDVLVGKVEKYTN